MNIAIMKSIVAGGRWGRAGLACCLLLSLAAAQTGTPASEGVTWGNYRAHQSFEFGGHVRDFSGNPFVWDSFVNMRSGPRLLEQSLSLNAPRGQGVAFDSLSISSFGYGGDPNSATRLRASLARWYTLSATFRRNLNYWDYNLLTNPLNPEVSDPALIVTNSPHSFRVVRRMSNFDLTLLPQSPVRFRFGYGHSTSEGPSFSPARAGTETVAFRNWRNRNRDWRGGLDMRYIPRTNISYDFFWSRHRGDTTWHGDNFLFQLADGTPVDLGIAFNTPATQPCAMPVTDSTTDPPTANPTCNGFLEYFRAAPVRTSFPTHQFSFQSRYVRRVDVTGRVLYSGAESNVNAPEEFFRGLVSRTRARQFEVTGPAAIRRVNVTADAGVTVHLTSQLRFSNNFRWTDFRIPGNWEMQQATLFSASMAIPPNVFDPATCPTITSPGCPQHVAQSPADLISRDYTRFLGQDAKVNTAQLEFDFTRRAGVRAGHRYRTRAIETRFFETALQVFFPTLPNRGACAGQPLDAQGICRVTTTAEHEEHISIQEHSFVGSFWARPTDALRFSFDTEVMRADNIFTRLTPRGMERFSFRTSYRPMDWMTLSSSLNLTSASNDDADIGLRRHNRNYTFNATLTPRESFAFDLGYGYQDFYSQAMICFVRTPAPPEAVADCPAPNPLSLQSFFDSNAHFVSTAVMWRPVARVTTNLGYTVNTVSGDTLLLHPLMSPGPLHSTYHLPSAQIAVQLAEQWTWRTAWNHYGYNERNQPISLPARDVRGNVFTLGLRYAF